MKLLLKRIVERAALVCALLCALTALTGCGPDGRARPFDPAVTAQLSGQSNDYAGLARWITQFTRTAEAAARLQAAGFTCTEYGEPAAATPAGANRQASEYQSYLCRETSLIMESVVVLETGANGYVARAGGVRKYPFFDRRFEAVRAPGIQFANASMLADFAADALQPARLSIDCVSADAPAGPCAAWAGARSGGWPQRGTGPLAAGTAQQVVERIGHTGFVCPQWNRQNMRTAVGTVTAAAQVTAAADDLMWIECRTQALFAGQVQMAQIGVSMADGTASRVRAVLGSEVQEFALAPKPEDENPTLRRVIIGNNAGLLRQIELAPDIQGSSRELTAALDTMDAPSRTRLLRVMLDMTERNLGAFPAQTLVPVLQQIDAGAALFARLGNEGLAAELPGWSLTPQSKTASVKTRAALAMARCLHGELPAAQACYAPVRVADPDVHTLLLAALEEVKADTQLLPPDHVAARRLRFLREVLGRA